MDMNELYLVAVRLPGWEFMAEASHINAKKAVRGLWSTIIYYILWSTIILPRTSVLVPWGGTYPASSILPLVSLYPASSILPLVSCL